MRSLWHVVTAGNGVQGRVMWVAALVLVVTACASSRTARDPFDDPFLDDLAADDPFFGSNAPASFDEAFDDPFFSEGMAAGDSLDEFLREPSPSVGWLSDDSPREPEGDPFSRRQDESGSLFGDEDEGDEGDEDTTAPDAADERPFAQQAQEAALATMSVLVGAGMAALPYLLAAF